MLNVNIRKPVKKLINHFASSDKRLGIDTVNMIGNSINVRESYKGKAQSQALVKEMSGFNMNCPYVHEGEDQNIHLISTLFIFFNN